ncbi:hypothetical protein Ahy_A09g046297 isoform D [Arachis hypogaea]|uniref:F-box domain-containing protein n=1 Tax=Arachis hypogaea TaxID=3818 RepID=A0A445BPF3_ARAHY|nr:hypothetical protein Ahy_A09g046297 isoform D [Arachis hypogaea]
MTRHWQGRKKDNEDLDEIGFSHFTKISSVSAILQHTGELRDFIKEMDKISDLPKIILHDILSRLPYEDAARTSVLSKAWHETWSSFPILVFDGSQGVLMDWKDRKDPLKIQENRRKANSFLKSVDRTLVRFHHHGFAIKEFNLSMMFFHPRFMPHRVDRWMKIVGESSSIQVLKLELELADCFFGCEFDSHAVDNYYYLPPDVLKAKSLTELVLLGRIRADKLIVNHRIRFPMLRILSLFEVYLGHEQALEDLISGCPMIEHLILEHCVGLENVKIHDLPKLKSAKFYGFREIHVDVPSLEYLHLRNDELEFPCDISIDKCRNLKVFFLGAARSVFVSNQWLRELFDKFPFLERLELSGCVTSESLMISSSRLKVLSFEACVELKEARIDAPNLESCRYSGQSSHMPAAMSFVNCSNQVDFDVVFATEFRIMDLKRLRAFFQNMAPRNVMVSLYLGIMRGSSIVFNEDVLQNVQVPLPRIKQLRLSVAEETEELCVLLINDLFWSFRPAIISLNVRLCSRIFLKLLLEKLRCNKEEERCCSSSQMKCWWHDLKDVKVRSSPKKYENLRDCEAFLDSLPINFSSPTLHLNFELEWDSLHTSVSGGGINAGPSVFHTLPKSQCTSTISVSAILEHTGELRDFIKEMDKISDLPKIILHDILSRLPYEDAARTSVLSKAWHETWSSFPILVFDGSRCVHVHLKDRKNPLKIQDNRRKVNRFFNSVDRTLVRFHHHGFAIKEFNLSMMFFHPRFMPHLVDRWMKIVGESSSIQVLKLELQLADCFFGCEFDSHAVDNYYYLPPDVLKAKSLTELVLSGKIRADKLIVNHRIRFPMLRILSLVYVYLGPEQALEDLISGCPMIEDLVLEHCVGLEIVKVHDLPKLKSAKFSGFREIHVDVPSLEYLELGNDKLEFPCDISIDKCRNLKVFILEAVSSVFVSNQWLRELFDKFPLLETLELSGSVTSESLMISSSRLKVLSFEDCLELKEAKIDAPNLESCRYSGKSSHMPAAISFVDFDLGFRLVSRMDLKRLRAFFQNMAPRNVMVSLYLGIMRGSSIVFNEDVLQNVQVPLPRIKQLRLSVAEETEELCVLLINDLFWSFRPAIISLNVRLCSRIFLKLLLEKLRCHNEEERCCSSSQMKCWWHDLKDVKVRSYPEKYENLSDCEALLDSLPINFSFRALRLNFELEWDSLQIDAPNLESCRYSGQSSHMPAAMSFVNCSNQVDFDVVLAIEFRIMDLKRLRAFLQNIAPRNVMVSLYLGIMKGSSIVFNEDVLQNVQVPLPRIKQLRLLVAEETEELCVLLINDLFWSFRPAIISLNLKVCSRIFLKLLLEKLRCNNEGEECSSSQMKCWWRDLKDVKVTSSPKKYENLSDCEALLDSLPINFSSPDLQLNFQLEWDSLRFAIGEFLVRDIFLTDEDLDEIGFSHFTKISSVSAILQHTGELRDLIKEMDKISDLPKMILHDILSRLPYKDAARTSVLSKAWHETWSSFPILVFDGSRCVRVHLKDRKDPLKIQDNRRKANSFLKSVDRTLVRFHHHGFAIKEFNLSMMFFHPRFMPHLVDRWMKIAGESSSIQVLKLELELAGCFFGCEFDSHAVDNYYYLPPDVLKAKSLTELVLFGKIRADKLIVNHRIRFPMLRILSLVGVYLGHEQALEDLISGCPMIEELILEHCVGLENVKVHDLPKLKSAKFSGFREIHVDVPSLENLQLGNDKLEFPCDISIDKCRNLKGFFLGAVSSVFVSNQWLLELFDKFPFLERLELSGCVTSESLMISSSRLKVLSFEACVELKEAKIDAPNLESCKYSGQFSHMPAAISFENCSNQVDFDVVFALEFRMDLKRLRAFIQNIAPRNVMVSLYLGIMKGSSIVFHEDVLENVQVPLRRIKQLRLSVDEETEEFCVLLINDLFWSFRPAIISLNLKLCSRIFLKLLLEKLRCNNEEERRCSSSHQMKCWWHDLKDVKVRSSPKKYENLSDCEELLDSLPINFFSPNLQLNFELEWDSLQLWMNQLKVFHTLPKSLQSQQFFNTLRSY